MISEDRRFELMAEAIREGELSQSEDERPHPKVGALLVNTDGAIIQRAHRGEDGQGGHAEYLLLEKARKANTDLRDKILFITLEPCTQRGPGKIPCALRIASSGLKSVWIGALDPNPRIVGRGETYLALHLDSVERFPGPIAAEVRRQNSGFFEQHLADHLGVLSIYSSPDEVELHQPELRPRLVQYREGLLQQSMDLITGSSGSVWIMAGDLSWFRELQMALLFAALDQRKIRILCGPKPAADNPMATNYDDALRAGLSLGSEIVEAQEPFPLRGTMIAPNSTSSSFLSIEPHPTVHGSLFRMPSDSTVLQAVVRLFEATFAEFPVARGVAPRLEPIDDVAIIDALRQGVPIYHELPISIEEVSLAELLPLPRYLERFKLFRVNQFEALRGHYSVPWACRIVGSPWPITPPVIERLPNDRFVVIDGAHRVSAAISRGETRIKAVVVTNSHFELPAQPLPSWDSVKLATQKRARHERYVEYRSSLFRPIRRAFSALTR